MPTTRFHNLCYRVLLPFAASPRGKMSLSCPKKPLARSEAWLALQRKHHVMASSLLLRSGGEVLTAHTSLPGKTASDDTLYRVASITKMATALTVMCLAEKGLLTVDAPVTDALPQLRGCGALAGVTLRHLLSHTSGLSDVPEYLRGLSGGETVQTVLDSPYLRFAEPGRQFRYCNFGYGLLGCVIEQASGLTVSEAMHSLVFEPLAMDAALDASALPEERIMGIERILSRSHAQVRKTELGRKPLTSPDPLRHYGHTAGAMYATVSAIDRLLSVFSGNGAGVVKPETAAEMMQPQADYGPADPGLHYGLGLFLVDRPEISPNRLIGHQGFAYGCVDGAFWECGTGRSVVFLNGGASELRLNGRMAAVNVDVLRWALKEEIPAW